MHIHFWADIRNTSGSVEKVILALASYGQRYQHHIACCPPKATRVQHYQLGPVKVHGFFENRVANRLLNKMLRLGAFTYPSLIRVIEEIRPAILHFHNRQELVDAVAKRLTYRPQIVVHYHRHFARPVAPASADLLLFVSAATRDDILGKTGARTRHAVLHNPLSEELLAAAVENCSVAANAPPVILFGGGSSPIKGGRELIAAFLQLPQGSARLVLAGHHLERLNPPLHPLIEVKGVLPAPEFLRLVAASDIVAMPSYDEPFGLVAQEAMLLRRLLVTTASGGLREFVDDACAVIVKPKDAASLAQGLLDALALVCDERRLAPLLDRAYERALAFAPQRIVKDLETLYDHCLG